LPIDALSEVADMVIECAPAKLVRSIVEPFVTSGKTAVVLSAAALLDHEDLIELAKRNGGQIVVPTGASRSSSRRNLSKDENRATLAILASQRKQHGTFRSARPPEREIESARSTEREIEI
jgi:hypothetical protein